MLRILSKLIFRIEYNPSVKLYVRKNFANQTLIYFQINYQ